MNFTAASAARDVSFGAGKSPSAAFARRHARHSTCAVRRSRRALLVGVFDQAAFRPHVDIRAAPPAGDGRQIVRRCHRSYPVGHACGGAKRLRSRSNQRTRVP